MGMLYYGRGMEVGMEDRLLAHLQITVGAKMRRHEAFFISWVDSAAVGSGRSAIWVDTGVSLIFRYASLAPIRINRLWLDALALSAETNQGMKLENEPGAIHDHTRLPHSHV